MADRGARRIDNAHRTVVDVARERVGRPYEDGKRLTDTFQYVCRCMCGWVGPTMATAGEARATGSVHRAAVKAIASEEVNDGSE